MGRIPDHDVADMRIMTNRFCFWAATMALPASAQAHARGDAPHWWTLDPWILLPLLVFGMLYIAGVIHLRGKAYAAFPARMPAIASAVLGVVALFFSLIWPLDAFSESSFAAHMAQHMILIAVAAPLLALARVSIPITSTIASASPVVAAWLALPRRWLRLCLTPSVAFFINGAVIWVWHAPLLFELALHSEAIHRLEHVSFLVAGYWYWSVLLREDKVNGEGYGAAALWSLSTLMHTGLLGALITFAPRPLYPTYIETQGGIAAALEDQQLAGLLMWVPMAVPYLIGGLAFAGVWLRNVDKQKEQRPT